MTALLAKPFSIPFAVEKPKPKITYVPTKTNAERIADWNRKHPIASTQQPPQNSKACFCHNCASIMTAEQLNEDTFQMVCPTCGVSGPRSASMLSALKATILLFSPI